MRHQLEQVLGRGVVAVCRSPMARSKFSAPARSPRAWSGLRPLELEPSLRGPVREDHRPRPSRRVDRGSTRSEPASLESRCAAAIFSMRVPVKFRPRRNRENLPSILPAPRLSAEAALCRTQPGTGSVGWCISLEGGASLPRRQPESVRSPDPVRPRVRVFQTSADAGLSCPVSSLLSRVLVTGLGGQLLDQAPAREP